MRVKDKEYQEHEIFNDLTAYAMFYERLSDLNMMWATQGVKALLNIDTYVFGSLQGTLESISDILKRGRINDAYALLRKYYDSAIINIYSNLYLDDHFSMENFVVEKINNWVKGTESIPSFEKMSKYILASKKASKITDLLYAKGGFKGSPFERLRQRCNDHTHYLYYRTLLLNNNEVYLPDRIDIIQTLQADLREVFILHISYLFHLNEHYMMSSDYLNILSIGETPDEGSQYIVAHFVQEIFDTILTPFRPDIAEVIKKNTKMQLS